MTQPPQIAGKGGRPKRQFTDEEKKKIGEYAHNNCHFDTIALALNIPVNTLKRHYGRFIKQKRAEGRVKLRENQAKLALTQPAMAIFLGKNVLGQVDKHIEVKEDQQRELSEVQKVEAQRIASIRLHQGVA